MLQPAADITCRLLADFLRGLRLDAGTAASGDRRALLEEVLGTCGSLLICLTAALSALAKHSFHRSRATAWDTLNRQPTGDVAQLLRLQRQVGLRLPLNKLQTAASNRLPKCSRHWHAHGFWDCRADAPVRSRAAQDATLVWFRSHSMRRWRLKQRSQQQKKIPCSPPQVIARVDEAVALLQGAMPQGISKILLTSAARLLRLAPLQPGAAVTAWVALRPGGAVAAAAASAPEAAESALGDVAEVLLAAVLQAKGSAFAVHPDSLGIGLLMLTMRALDLAVAGVPAPPLPLRDGIAATGSLSLRLHVSGLAVSLMSRCLADDNDLERLRRPAAVRVSPRQRSMPCSSKGSRAGSALPRLGSRPFTAGCTPALGLGKGQREERGRRRQGRIQFLPPHPNACIHKRNGGLSCCLPPCVGSAYQWSVR